MSTMSWWGPKNWGMLQEDEGKAAVGLPQEEMSIESVAVEMDAGTLERYGRKVSTRTTVTVRYGYDLRSRTRCWIV